LSDVEKSNQHREFNFVEKIFDSLNNNSIFTIVIFISNHLNSKHMATKKKAAKKKAAPKKKAAKKKK